MSVTSLITRLAVPTPKLEKYERFMFIGPHPDDIEIGAGAAALKLAAQGKKVCYLICIDGRFGSDYAPEGTTPEELIAIRKAEAVEAAARAGVTDVRFLEFCDGGLYDAAELERAMARAIGSFKPEVIFAPDPDVTSECHVDHLNVGRAAKKLAFLMPFADIVKNYGAESAPIEAIALYMTAKPNGYVRTGGCLKKQLEIIETCFPSQYPASNPALGSVKLYIKLRAYEFGLRRLCGTAEGFRILGKTQMHCLPEAGR